MVKVGGWTEGTQLVSGVAGLSQKDISTLAPQGLLNSPCGQPFSTSTVEFARVCAA